MMRLTLTVCCTYLHTRTETFEFPVENSIYHPACAQPSRILQATLVSRLIRTDGAFELAGTRDAKDEHSRRGGKRVPDTVEMTSADWQDCRPGARVIGREGGRTCGGSMDE